MQRARVDPTGMNQPHKKEYVVQVVKEGMRKAYFDVVKPLEMQYHFHELHNTSVLGVGDFTAAPSVLLVGQYSTGKTSFIKYMLGRDFPGQRIGPEPTTDRFHAISYGEVDRNIPGNAAAAQPDSPWTGLKMFGVEFLNRFEVAEMSCPVTQEITFVDSPGILAGEKQRVDRGYDFVKTTRWFAERADKILLLFDAHKLDISDEFKRVIENMQFAHTKVTVVLNKADMITTSELLRVYGALMWSLGKIFKTPEASRVYVSSFWEGYKKDHEFVKLFDQQREGLMKDLRQLPQEATMSKVNELVKRCKLLKVHICIIGYLKSQMPSMFGKSKKIEKLLENMPEVFMQVKRKYNLPVGDFPNLDAFRDQLQHFDFSKFKTTTDKQMQKLDQVIEQTLPGLVAILSGAHVNSVNPFDDPDDGTSKFLGANDPGGAEWVVDDTLMAEARQAFEDMTLTPDGRAGGAEVKKQLLQTGLEVSSLRAIWNLAAIDGKGSLDIDEMALAMFLANMCKDGQSLPEKLPLRFVPPSKRASPLFAQ